MSNLGQSIIIEDLVFTEAQVKNFIYEHAKQVKAIDKLKDEKKLLRNRLAMVRTKLTNVTLGEYLDMPPPYVAMYFTGNGPLPSIAREKLDEYFDKLTGGK